MSDPQQYVEKLGRQARTASRELAAARGSERDAALLAIAASLRNAVALILAANTLDLEAARKAALAPAMIERLRLDEKRLNAMAASVESIGRQSDPVGRTIEAFDRPDGLRIEKRRVPLGVVLFFYESRPNVTTDAAALCLKSGNAIILRGGKEARHSNQALASVIAAGLKSTGLNPHAVQLVESTDRALVPLILKLDQHIDVAIPRGGESLIRTVVAEATMPVLKHFNGNCHLYIDAAITGIEDKVTAVCVNAKTSYPGGGVCNAVEHLLFHKDAAPCLLASICAALADKGVEIRGDAAARALYPAAKAVTEKDWDEEYLSFIVSVKVVDDTDAAIEHINTHSSHHTDGILSTSIMSINRFVAGVDSASVMVNASTRLADGGEYLLGAEIGISTDKLHARGPMGAADLTTYKWIVTGDGHVR